MAPRSLASLVAHLSPSPPSVLTTNHRRHGRELPTHGRRGGERLRVALLAENGYPVPPDMRVGHRYGISVRGIPVAKPLTRANKDFPGTQVMHFWRELTPEERDDPRWNPEDPGSAPRYEAFRCPVPRDKNAAGREVFWSVPHRTLQNVMDHIAAGGSLLEWPATPYYYAAPPPPPAPPAHVWAPRLSPPSSSRSTASSSRPSSSSSRAGGLLTPKPEPGTSQAEASLYAELKAAQEAHDEEELLRQAEAASLNDVPPMDKQSACAWSAFMHDQETGVPFLDLTGDAPGASRVKKGDDGGAGTSGVKEEEKDPTRPSTAATSRLGF